MRCKSCIGTLLLTPYMISGTHITCEPCCEFNTFMTNKRIKLVDLLLLFFDHFYFLFQGV